MNAIARSLRWWLTLPWLAAAGLAQAAWVVEPSAEIRTEYESNLRLEVDDEDDTDRDAVVTSATLQGTLRSVTERSDIAAVAGINYVTYGSDSGSRKLEDRGYQFAAVSASRTRERGTFGINTLYRRDDLFRQVYLVPGSGEPIVGDPTAPEETGGASPPPPELFPEEPPVTDPDDVDVDTLATQVRRTTVRAAPYYRHSFSERTSSRFVYLYSQMRIDEEVVGIADSDMNGVAVDLQHEWSEIDRGELNVRASRFEAGEDVDADLYEATLGWTRRLAPQTRVTLRAGAYETDSQTGRETGFVLGILGARRTLSGRMVMGLERSVVPSVFGDLLEADRLTVRYEHALSERWEVDGRIRAFRTDSLLRRSEDRDYVEAGAEVRWTMTPSISVGGSYHFRWIERDVDAADATGHVVGISLAYRPPGILRARQR